METPPLPDPKGIWPDLTDWHVVKVMPAVSRVRLASGDLAYVRPDDGSAPVLRRLRAEGALPVPDVLDAQQGWLLLSGLPGVPLHDAQWAPFPLRAAGVAADALRRLEQAGVRHGDMCIPNILGDVEAGLLTGIVDWGYEGQFDREIDVASTTWSFGFNGFSQEAAIAVLEQCGWPRADPAEVERLCAVWVALAGPVDMDLVRLNEGGAGPA